jgi:hypothetical protein
MKLTTDGIAALDAIGFDWRLLNPILQPSGSPGDDADNAPAQNQRSSEKGDQIFQDHVEALREYKKNNGLLNVSRDIDKSLFNWCSNIRSARSKPGKGKMQLTQERIAALDAIGFDWSQKISFIDRVEALRAYKEKHGHLCVSKKDEKSLFHWCSNIRNARKNPESCQRKVTADRIAALDAIGFEWRLAKSDLQLSDSLDDDADNAFGKSEENNNTVQDCQCVGDGFHHDDLEYVEIPKHQLLSKKSVLIV